MPYPEVARVRGMRVRRPALPLVATSLLVVAWTAWWAWRAWPVSGLSWHFFADGSRLLLHGSGLNLYAEHPELQTGPLSLAVAALLGPLPANIAKSVALIAMTAAGPLLLVALGACVRNAKPTGESLDALHHEGPKSQKLGQPLPGSRILSFFLHK